MFSNPLLKAIKIIGSRQDIIKMLGISGQRLNAWLNGNVAMGFEYALALEYLTGGQVTSSELAPKKAQILKKLKINISHHLKWLTRKPISIADIKLSECISKPLDDIEELVSDIEKHGLLRPIIIDPKHTLISGERRLCAYKLIGKNTIPTFLISLEALLNDQEAGYQLRKYFTISERTAIGIALEHIIGNRQGQRTDLQPLQDFAEVGANKTTREKVAFAIGFNNAETYRQAKKVIQAGIRLLIDSVDEEKISISAAYEIATLPADEQKQILLKDNKDIMERVKQLKANKKIIH